MLPKVLSDPQEFWRGATRNVEVWINALVIAWAIGFVLWQGTGFAITVGTVFAIWAILAVSLNLLVGFTGLLSVAHIGFFGIGAYVMAILTSDPSYEQLAFRSYSHLRLALFRRAAHLHGCCRLGSHRRW